MNPIAFHLFGRPVFWYGIFAATGFLAGLIHWTVLARRAGQPPERASDLAFSVMIGGILGARIAYVGANLEYFLADPVEIFRVDHGGLIFYGGFIGAVIGVLCLARRKKTPLWPLADFAVSALPLGHAFGRIGCFLNGCCHGLPAPSGWPGIRYPANSAAGALYGAIPVHPVQLYEAGFNLLLYLALLTLWIRPGRKRPGAAVALYAASYGALRFGLEFLRGDPRLRVVGLSVAQWFSLGLIVLAPLILRIARPTRPAPPRKNQTNGTLNHA